MPDIRLQTEIAVAEISIVATYLRRAMHEAMMRGGTLGDEATELQE